MCWRRVSENLLRLDGKGSSSDRHEPRRQQEEVVMTLSDVHNLQELLYAMGENIPPRYTKLKPVFYQNEHCAWVCKEPHRDAVGNVFLDCSKRFHEQGNARLQIRVTK